MKKHFYQWLLLCAMTFVAACSDGGEEIDNPQTPSVPEQPTITLGGSSSSDFPTDGGSNTLSFTASTDWTAEVINSRADAWCSVSPTSGKAGNAQITITTTANDTPDNRSASVILKAGTTQKTITVSQKQKDALTVTSDKFEVSAEGGEIKIEVKANIDFEYSIAYEGSAKDWITSGGARALKTSTLTFKVAANEEVEKREATVTIKSGSFKEEVKVYQAGTTPSITLTKNEFVVASAGESIAVEVKSNVDVTVELPTDVDWISENQSRAMSTNTYHFTIAESQEYDQRTAEIKFTNKANNLSETVKVVQVQKDAIVVAKDSYTVDNNGGEIIIEVGHNIDFEIEIADEWIVQKKENSRAFVTDKLIFNISPNEGYDNRESSIRFVSKDKGIVQTVKIYQAQKNAIIISQKNIIVDENGGDVEFEVKSNIDYTISEPNVDWLHILKSRALTSQTLRYTVDANTTYDSRETSIIITSDNFADTINIAQTQKDAIVLAKNEYGFTAEGGELDFEILTNVDVTVSIPDSISNWVKQVKSRALVSQILHFDISPCDLSESRSGTITLSGGDAVQTILIKQEQMKIDPAAIPDNEIWYTTKDNSLFSDWTYYKTICGEPFDKEILSHTYINGIGKIVFNGPLTRINDNAFSSYGNYTLHPKILTNIYLPNKVEYIGDGAFGNQKEIETFKVPNSKFELRGSAFQGAKVMKFIGENILPKGEGILVDGILYALSYNELQEELIIPNSVKEIAAGVMNSGLQDFCVRPQLKSIIISEGVRKINNNAFQYCTNLEKVSLPNSLEELGTYIFRFCPRIKEFVGNSQYVTEDGKCFLDIIYANGKKEYGIQTAVKVGLPDNYVIPENITTIRPCAFEGINNLRSITLPNSLMLIESGGEIFKNCPNFEFIYGNYASEDNKCALVNNCFWNDGNALLAFAGKNVVEYKTSNAKHIGDFVFAYQNELQKITINDEVTNIGNYCFSYSPNLRSITLPANLKVFRYDPFIGSNNIETIYFRSSIPPRFEIGGIEQSQYSNLTIYVPEQSLQLYLKDSNWALLHKYMKGYKYTDLPEVNYYTSTDYSQDGKVTTLQTATKGNGIDIVLMGDGYSDRQIADGTYDKTMNIAMEKFFSEEPYKTYRDHFNVYSVKAVSATEGYDHGNTAFSGFFGDGTLVGGNDNHVFNYALKAIGNERMNEALVVVMMNSTRYAGTCYMYYPSVAGGYGNGVSISYFPVGEDENALAQVLHHEAGGHGFAKLADEYAYEDMGAIPATEVTTTKEQQNTWGWWKNVDFTSAPSATRWSHFINDTRYANDGLGAYEGGLTYWTGVWRPTENSIMRYNTGGFNAPSREAIYYRIHKLAYGDSWQYDYEEFVKYDAINRKAAASSYNPYRQTNYKPLHAPVVIRKSWKDAQ